ncbi:MAG: bifunctional riboflavin kinase/FAD synthetase [Clostridia bacterium]
MVNKRVIALGTFDGLHIGHRELIGKAIELGQQNDIPCMIYTFTTHPLTLFNKAPRLLMSEQERIAALHRFNCEVEAVDFDAAFAALSPRDFVVRLIKEYNMAIAVAGFNYSFGAGGTGNIDELRSLGEELGFEVCEIAPAYFDGGIVSSSRIRACLEQGDIASANSMLTEEYTMCGSVTENRHIGRKLGFPTANIVEQADKVLPKCGVYATRARVCGKEYMSITNIGNNPTVNGKMTTMETHILDFEGDIYGEWLSVCFVQRLREDVRFNSIQELAAQISADAQAARKILGKMD